MGALGFITGAGRGAPESGAALCGPPSELAASVAVMSGGAVDSVAAGALGMGATGAPSSRARCPEQPAKHPPLLTSGRGRQPRCYNRVRSGAHGLMFTLCTGSRRPSRCQTPRRRVDFLFTLQNISSIFESNTRALRVTPWPCAPSSNIPTRDCAPRHSR